MVAPQFSRYFAQRKSEKNSEEASEKKVRLCDKVETARELKYVLDSVNVDGGCGAGGTARRRFGWD